MSDGWERKQSHLWERRVTLGDKVLLIHVNWRTPNDDGTGSYWWCDIYQDGKQLYQKVKFDTDAEAMRDAELACDRFR